ncbi:ABC transporter permease [Streptomyces litchfieldiae]|uniref:ABC transporter permease n=1 Tax=Streptomyces litchfieldiae TaxID=3075543 RepID=A0ABU2MVN2_9ACTN|nr:ABC transporter permease [Streptomyces sp. DSM 44938]MDT0345707.1 ABC transporter permease [Streptomyces sp. DSM 44938]
MTRRDMAHRAIRLLAGRLAVTGGLLLLLSVVVFAGTDLLPGDPATARLGGLGPAEVAEARARLGLDRPLAERYGEWVTGLLRGDLGTSAEGRPVGELLSERLGNSLLLAGLTLAVLVPGSLLLGVAAGLRQGRAVDRAVTTGMLLLAAVPEFVVAGGLVLLFAVTLGWLPAVSLVPAGASPLSVPEVLVLPVLSLLLLGLAYATRLIRAATAAAARAPHVEFMRINGLPPRTVLREGVLPAVLPVALQVWLTTGAGLIGGAVLVERVFGYPGIGDVLIRAVQSGDLPVVQALAMLLGGVMLLALFAADLSTRALTPVLRTAGR